jgi:hypothetical protein
MLSLWILCETSRCSCIIKVSRHEPSYRVATILTTREMEVEYLGGRAGATKIALRVKACTVKGDLQASQFIQSNRGAPR